MICAVDLHIHSCLSPCADDEMTPASIAGMAFIKGLDAIAVTDHNTCQNLPAAQAACDEYGVVLLPGMEAETREEVHVLCYFPSVPDALAFEASIREALPDVPNPKEIFGNQLIMDADDNLLGERTQLLLQSLDLSLDELLEAAHAHGGVCVPSHINRQANSLLYQLGFIPPGSAFAGLEIDRRAASPTADTAPYKIFYSSDAHTLGDISERDFTLDIREKSTAALMERLRAYRARVGGGET